MRSTSGVVSLLKARSKRLCTLIILRLEVKNGSSSETSEACFFVVESLALTS